MKCIHCYSPLVLIHSQIKHKQQLKKQKLLWLSTNATTQLQKGENILLPVQSRTNAVTSSLVLGLTSPATTRDVTVLLQTSAGLFLLYWIVNFVLPQLITNNLQKKSKEQKPNDDKPLEDEEGSTTISRTSSPERKKGFESTKH